MRDDQFRFLSVHGQLPARLNAEQTAWVLNCQPHDIPGLVSARLLKPLGNPPTNGCKYFATVEILEVAKDRAWLNRMSGTIYNHWRAKNSTKSKSRFPVPPESAGTPLPGPGGFEGIHT